MDVSPDKFARVVKTLRLWSMIMLWAIVGMSFGLSIYTASVLEKRITTRDDELKIYRGRSEIIPSFPFRVGPYDAAFTQRFNQICATPFRRMNQPGGFTSAKNCPMIGRTYEWRISTTVERNLLCKSFQAYTSSTVGDEVAVWGRCDYQPAIDNCIFKSGNTDNVGATSSAECENQESIAATASLVNSNAAQLAASGQLQEVNEYFQANGDANSATSPQNNAATVTITQQPNAPYWADPVSTYGSNTMGNGYWG